MTITPYSQRIHAFLAADGLLAEGAQEIVVLRKSQEIIDSAVTAERNRAEGFRKALNEAQDQRAEAQRRFNEDTERMVAQVEVARAEQARAWTERDSLQRELEQARGEAERLQVEVDRLHGELEKATPVTNA